jgi:hypothetical protein
MLFFSQVEIEPQSRGDFARQRTLIITGFVFLLSRLVLPKICTPDSLKCKSNVHVS